MGNKKAANPKIDGLSDCDGTRAQIRTEDIWHHKPAL